MELFRKDTGEADSFRKSLEFAEKDIKRAANQVMEIHKIATSLYKIDGAREESTNLSIQVDALCSSLGFRFSNEEEGVLKLKDRGGKTLVEWNREEE